MFVVYEDDDDDVYHDDDDGVGDDDDDDDGDDDDDDDDDDYDDDDVYHDVLITKGMLLGRVFFVGCLQMGGRCFLLNIREINAVLASIPLCVLA